jgi:hypothetical protein
VVAQAASTDKIFSINEKGVHKFPFFYL